MTQQSQACGSSGGSSLHSSSPRQSPGRDDQQGGIVARLMREEEVLRRYSKDSSDISGAGKLFRNIFTGSRILLHREVSALQGGGGGLGEKEMMILLQQRKIAALDEANNRLVGIHFSEDCC